MGRSPAMKLRRSAAVDVKWAVSTNDCEHEVAKPHGGLRISTYLGCGVRGPFGTAIESQGCASVGGQDVGAGQEPGGCLLRKIRGTLR